MNLCLFFEGTGRGVAGKVTNVTRLRDICVDDVRQKLHLEAGPGTRLGSYLCGKIAGSDGQAIFRDARRISRRPARRPRRGLESLGRVRPRPPQFTPNQIALRLQRTLMCGGSEAVERKSERGDTAYTPRLHELSATASRILLRMVESDLENRECGMVESE